MTKAISYYILAAASAMTASAAGNTSVAQGKTVTLSVAASGTQPFTYQWYKAAAPIPGANSATYTIMSVVPSDSGTYYAKVSNPSGETTSDNGVISVLWPSTSVPPVIKYLGHDNAWASQANPAYIYWSCSDTAKVTLTDPNGATLTVPETGSILITQGASSYQWTLTAINADGVSVTKIDGCYGSFTAAQINPPHVPTIQEKEQQAATAAGVAYDAATRKFGPISAAEVHALNDALNLLGL